MDVSVAINTVMSRKSTAPYWRQRQTGKFASPTAVYASYQAPNGASYNDSFGNGTVEWMADLVTPNFRELQSRGVIVMSPMSRVTQTKLCMNKSTASGRYNGNPNYWWQYVSGPRTIWTMGLGLNSTILPGDYSVHSASDVDRLQIEASTRCLSRVGRASTDSYENLAETQKSLDMMWSPIRRFWRWVDRYDPNQKRRKRRLVDTRLRSNVLSGLRRSEEVANLWLMYRYGIRPLVSSLIDINDALQVAIENRKTRETVHGQATSSSTSFSTVSYSNSGYTWSIRKSITETINVRAVSIDEIVQDMAHDLGFDRASLLQLPWNLIPYSFVADWFVNFGEYIGALANCFRPETLGRCLTTRVVRSGVWENIACTSSPSFEGMLTPHLDLVREDAINIWRSVGLRTPGIVHKANFGFENAERVGDALALIGQHVLGRFSKLARELLPRR